MAPLSRSGAGAGMGAGLIAFAHLRFNASYSGIAMRRSTDGLMVSELLIIIAIVVALGLAFLQYQKTQKPSAPQSMQPALTHG